MPTLVRGLKTLADWLIHSIHTSSTYYMPYTLAGIVDRKLSKKKKTQKLLPYGAYVLVITVKCYVPGIMYGSDTHALLQVKKLRHAEAACPMSHSCA